MRTNYQRGRDFEYRTRNKLLKMGAGYVMRAAQSKGKLDLIALWPFGSGPHGTTRAPWLIQCKRDGKLPWHEKAELLALADELGLTIWLAKAGPKGRGVEFIKIKEEE